MGGRGFTGATSRRAAKLEKQIGAANAELEMFDKAKAEAEAAINEEYADIGGIGGLTQDEYEVELEYQLAERGFDYEKTARMYDLAEKRDADQAELDRINHGQFALFNVTTGKTKTPEPKKQTLDEYLAERGLSSAFSDYTVDKTRNPHGLTHRQRAKLEADTLKAGREYSARRNAAISEYHAKVKSGKIVTPSRVEQLMKKASGHSDNASVQAARRALTKRGYDWRTGKKL